MKVIVTGGAGFIGSNLVKHLINDLNYNVLNLDKLTYASNLKSLEKIKNSHLYSFSQVDINNIASLEKIINEYQPNKIIHLAAESHVDRSIDNADEFVKTNIIGTYNILEVTKKYYFDLSLKDKIKFRLHHVSTDEVFGSIDNTDGKFNENSPYDPKSPYAATKASSDHLVRAWINTFSIPAIITNCSNNYGPWQFPEKLIPLTIIKAIDNELIPIYGDGLQIRDWLFVNDHVNALSKVMLEGVSGTTYNIGGNAEMTNLEIVGQICELLDQLIPKSDSYSNLITHVEDRPGHDRRYAMDTTKICKELNWTPSETFSSGLKKTVKWYIENINWCREITKKKYKGERLGLFKNE